MKRRVQSLHNEAHRLPRIELRPQRPRKAQYDGSDNILKRLLIHGAACNLGLLMRTRYGVGTPRGLQGLGVRILAPLPRLIPLLKAVSRCCNAASQ